MGGKYKHSGIMLRQHSVEKMFYLISLLINADDNKTNKCTFS